MNKPLRGLRAFAASISLATALTTAGLVVGPLADAQFGTVSAVTAVNVRSTPSTSGKILTVLYKGSKATQTGSTKNGWVPVQVNGIKGWVSQNYLIGARATADAPASTSGSRATLVTLAPVNVRTGPSTAYRSITVLAKGTKVSPTGLVAKGWTQVTLRDQRVWISTAWLGDAATSSTSTSTPKTSGETARATADLLVRSSPGRNFTTLGEIPRGTVLDLTGLVEPGVAQVVWRGEYRWVNANYLVSVSTNPAPAVPKVPVAIGTQYSTATWLSIRSSSSSSAYVITDVPFGTALKVTGTVANGRAEIVWNGASRWVTAQYLSANPPLGQNLGWSSGLDGLTPRAKVVVAEAREKFPFILTIYGVRQDPLPDHPSGRAVDLMIPSWSTSAGNARGWEVATYYRANAKRLGIQYIIWDQKIWNVTRDAEGWRLMADRGGSTANHKDHVHITVQP
ncbi:SH3 domain-containing protein [Aestuariimicrobium ganziense]|uniref:SH3 domain-containing protein n=1 Tax=Aestuariimicrobium ganziense TaxID=2773677 RepID=UPI00194454BE|nr:SH3 domain-containing protein [Aestuariimicrobium ganziense]